ncbi:MAG: NBR1-Ig-like domain-containing protein [Anaerolineaceae bacterium]|nr:NBR1-Ig-like domain-containing protein [Anaerolineaceae bacterium]
MKNLMPVTRKIALVILIGLFTGCFPQKSTPTSPPEPTVDIPALRTEVAQTIVAEVTNEAALAMASQPTATVPPPNTTIPPTITSTLTEIPPVMNTSTATSIPATLTSTATQVIQASYPTFTPTFYTDRAELVSINPINGTYFGPGAGFDLVFTIKNVGMRPWNANFYLKYVSGLTGKTHSGQNVTLLMNPGAVAYGDTVTFVIDMIAPLQAGNYSSTWALINDDGTAFFWPSLVFSVQ